MSVDETILSILHEKSIPFEVCEHEPVYTNSTMAMVLKVKESQTVKSLVLKTKEGKLVVLVLPGDKKMDWKKVADVEKTKRIEFAKPEEVRRAVGCEVGCVPPFGHLATLSIYMDRELTKKDFVYFNPGVHHKSFKIKAWDLKRLCSPILIQLDKKKG